MLRPHSRKRPGLLAAILCLGFPLGCDGLIGLSEPSVRDAGDPDVIGSAPSSSGNPQGDATVPAPSEPDGSPDPTDGFADGGGFTGSSSSGGYVSSSSGGSSGGYVSSSSGVSGSSGVSSSSGVTGSSGGSSSSGGSGSTAGPPAAPQAFLIHAAGLPGLQFCFGAGAAPTVLLGSVQPGTAALDAGGLPPGLATQLTVPVIPGEPITVLAIPDSALTPGVTDCETLVGAAGSGGTIGANQFYRLPVLGTPTSLYWLMALTGCPPRGAIDDAGAGVCGPGYDPVNGNLALEVTDRSVAIPTPAGVTYSTAAMLSHLLDPRCDGSTCDTLGAHFGFETPGPDGGLSRTPNAQDVGFLQPGMTVVLGYEFSAADQASYYAFLDEQASDGGIVAGWQWSLDDIARSSKISDNPSGYFGEAGAFEFVALGDPNAPSGGPLAPGYSLHALAIPLVPQAADGGSVTSGCVPKTCAEQGYDCGTVADGCGGLIDCGSCTAPD